MKKQVLSIEQMKHLQSLGVDTSKASMYWTFPKSPEYKTRLSIVGEHGNLKAWEENGHGIGAFTLQDLIEILPYDVFGDYNFWLMKSNSGYKFSVKNNPDSAKIGTHFHDSPLEAVYDILCWYLKNK